MMMGLRKNTAVYPRGHKIATTCRNLWHLVYAQRALQNERWEGHALFAERRLLKCLFFPKLQTSETRDVQQVSVPVQGHHDAHFGSIFMHPYFPGSSRYKACQIIKKPTHDHGNQYPNTSDSHDVASTTWPDTVFLTTQQKFSFVTAPPRF